MKEVLRRPLQDALQRAFHEAGPTEAETVTWATLRYAALELANRLGLPRTALEGSRLGRGGPSQGERLRSAAPLQIAPEWWELPRGGNASEERQRRAAHLLGELLDAAMALRMQLEGARPGHGSVRRSTGSFFTPRGVCAAVVELALDGLIARLQPSDEPARARASAERAGAPQLTICDPAVGGGAFLIECCSALARVYRAQGLSPEDARRRAASHLWGVDRSELALATAEAALWLYVGAAEFAPAQCARLAWGDALCGGPFAAPNARRWAAQPDPPSSETPSVEWGDWFPDLDGRGFDLVIGNPPWVAYAGRSAQALPPEWREFFKRRYRSFSGFPTLHALFVERSAALAPLGRVALLLPSPLADLDGYRAAREMLTQTHDVQSPLLELGQDAFSGVVQPCFALVADARAGDATQQSGSPGAWVLAERARAGVEVVRESPPDVLTRLERAPRLAPRHFRELGFQSNRQVSERLFLRSAEPSGPYRVPLLEGRRVREFEELAPGLFLWDDPEELARARCRLRPAADYAQVDFVIRQTAAITIAARHRGGAFRNSLLAGFGDAELDADLLVGLLNSSLLRAWHLSRQRDARQQAFPQVKIAHLRSLPAPPPSPELRALVRRLSRDASERRRCPPDLRRELDDAVDRLYGLAPTESDSVRRYLQARLGTRSLRAAPSGGNVVEPRGIEPLTS